MASVKIYEMETLNESSLCGLVDFWTDWRDGLLFTFVRTVYLAVSFVHFLILSIGYNLKNLAIKDGKEGRPT